MRTSRLQLLLILLALGLVLMRESRSGPGAELEHRFVDWLSANTVRVTPEAPLTLVEIDDSSLGSGHAWPWSPLDFSLFLQSTLPFQPAVLAIEHVLNWGLPGAPDDEPSAKQRQYERILHGFILRAPKIVVGAQLGFPEDPDLLPPLEPVKVLRHVTGSVNAIPEFTTINSKPAEPFRLAPTLGFTNLPASSSPLRRAPLLLRYRGELVPAFPLQALMLFYGVTPDEVRIKVGSHIDLGNKHRIPIDEAGSVRVYFKAAYDRFGFDNLLLATQQAQSGFSSVIDLKKLNGRIAMLARTDNAARKLSFPSGSRGSSGELFAAAIATIQNETYLRPLPLWGEIVTMIAVLALAWLFMSLRRATVLQIALAATVIYLLVGMTVFSRTLIWLPLLMPLGLLLFAVLFRSFARDDEPHKVTSR